MNKLPTSLKSFKVLYVEDEPLIAIDGEEMLRDLGFDRVVVALTFDDATAAIDREAFDLAVMDINLGSGRTSIPLAERLARHDTILILASGYNSADEIRTTDCGYRLEKPFDQPALLRAVLTATERSGRNRSAK